MTERRTSPVVPVEEVPPAGMHSYRPAVLVVDDELTIADTVSEILSRSGYAVSTAYDAEEALEIALVNPPELLLTDVVLPGMSGIELAITLTRIFPQCKVLLFSGVASTADLLARAQCEGHNFTLLSKPLHPKELLTKVFESVRPVSSTAA